MIFMEQCFLATAGSWAECFNERNRNYACLGYFYDDLAHYYMAEFPNRLIEKLNSEEELAVDQRTRASQLIWKLVDKKISKYNSQPIEPIEFNPKFSRRVLVCDQTFPDASVQYGLAGEDNFDAMLEAAIVENPDAEIIVKLHPDTHWDSDRKTGYLNKVEERDNLTLLRTPANPFSLFENVDKVYVVTSHIGFEALLAGKQVVCFGSPFYAGWGLTDDRQNVPHRHRARSLTEIFHFTYIWYTIYNVPGIEGVAEVEDAVRFILGNRVIVG